MKKITALLLSIMTAATFSACAEKDTADSDASSSVAEAAASGDTENADSDDTAEDNTDAVMEKFGYNGTFSDEVFETIASNIIIGDDVISLPFQIDEVSENFSFENNSIFYKGYEIGNAVCEYQDPNKIDALFLKRYLLKYAEENGEEINISIGGVKYGDSEELILKYFGEPNNKITENDTDVFQYYIFDDESEKYVLCFTFEEGEINKFELQNLKAN